MKLGPFNVTGFNNSRKRAQQIALGLFVLLTFAHSSLAQITTNDLLQNTSGQYTVTGSDPYIVFNALETTENATYLVMDFGGGLNNVALELFFSSKNDVFDPQFKLNFIATKFPIALVLPKELVISGSTRLRLDFNQCLNCIISFEKPPTLLNDWFENAPIDAINVQNGIQSVRKTALQISPKSWKTNNLDGDALNFEVLGTDPYLVSPPLNSSTHQLAGVYFKLKAPRSGKAWNYYQLFYQTDRHSFEATASATIRLPDTAGEFVEFMIPLHFLSRERPSDTILERLRLDLPEISGPWSLVEAKLIHQDLAHQYKNYIPKQIIQTKQQRATGLALIKKSVINVASDTSFLVAYLLLLGLTGLFLRRIYRLNQ